MTNLYSTYLADESALLQFGQQLAAVLRGELAQRVKGITIYLHGQLGAGKTTLTRSIVQAFGHQGNVKSPTYTLVEAYQLAPFSLYHFDLYRLASPEELEFIGIRDYFAQNSLCLIEWAEKGEGFIPPADLHIELTYQQTGRNVQLFSDDAALCRVISEHQWL